MTNDEVLEIADRRYRTDVTFNAHVMRTVELINNDHHANTGAWLELDEISRVRRAASIALVLADDDNLGTEQS